MEEVLQLQTQNQFADYYANEFEDELFNPTPYKRTTVEVVVGNSPLLAEVASKLLAEMNRVYKGFNESIKLSDGSELTAEHLTGYLQALVMIRVAKSNGDRLDDSINVNYRRIQVPSFIYPIIAKIGPVVDVKRGLRIVPVTTIKPKLNISRTQIEEISEIFFSLRQYNFSSEAGIPLGTGSLDLMSCFTTTDSQGKVSTSSMVFSYQVSHPVNGFYSALLGIVPDATGQQLVSEGLRIKFGNISDYVGSLPRVLRPRQK